MITARFEEIGKTDKIARHVGIGMSEAVAHARLSGEMNDDFRLGVPENPVERIPIRDVANSRGEPERPIEIAKPRLLEFDIVIGREIVESRHGMAFGEKPFCNMIADEACHSGDENSHL